MKKKTLMIFYADVFFNKGRKIFSGGGEPGANLWE
jgi:hypothetical protein